MNYCDCSGFVGSDRKTVILNLHIVLGMLPQLHVCYAEMISPVGFYHVFPLDMLFILVEHVLHYLALNRRVSLKLKVRKYPAMHTNRMLYHCTTLLYNHNIWHSSYAEAKF